MTTNFVKIKIVSILCLLSIAALGVSACENTEYKTMSVKEGIQGFSFEYPNSYSLIHLDLENTPTAKYSEVGLSTNNGNSHSEIYVYLWVPSPDMSSAELIMNKLVENSENTLENFSLLNETTIMLGDTIVRQVMFTADSASPDNTGQSGPRPATYRLATMIYGGLAVEIDMTCDKSITDPTAEHYQHVLDTFAVVN